MKRKIINGGIKIITQFFTGSFSSFLNTCENYNNYLWKLSLFYGQHYIKVSVLKFLIRLCFNEQIYTNALNI